MGANLFLGAESLAGGNGGIARLARLTARVVGDEVAAGRLRARGLALGEPGGPAEFGFPVGTARRSRPRFLLEAHRAALACSHFQYDFLGMARAHCRLPLMRRPCMVWIHGIEIWEEARPVRLRTARRADLLVANSGFTRDRAERLHGGFSRARVCWLATEHDEPPPPRPRPGGPPTVLIVGRIDEGGGYKGHAELLDAWPGVVAAVPDARLLVVGGGPGLAALRRRTASSAAAAHVELAGFVPEEGMDAVWARAHVFAMPSRGEGFGLVYVEAMRHGLPVVASTHDAGQEINRDGVTGYNVNLDRPEELTDRLIHLLKHPGHAAALGDNGRVAWQERFRYSAFRARFRPILTDFLNAQ
jgi:phosphatidylinositol alpha-1,6-mannosyltransferase